MGLADPQKRGVQALIRDLNHLYRDLPALHRKDCEADGFEWLVGDDAQNSVFVWLRKGGEGEHCIVALNLTPQVPNGYRFAVPRGGEWREILNTDSEIYGGSNVGNGGVVGAAVEGDRFILTLDLPPLAGLLLAPAE